MIEEQCRDCVYCSRGMCFADRQAGHPLSIISYCGHANPPGSLSEKKYKIIKPKKK